MKVFVCLLLLVFAQIVVEAHILQCVHTPYLTNWCPEDRRLPDPDTVLFQHEMLHTLYPQYPYQQHQEQQQQQQEQTQEPLATVEASSAPNEAVLASSASSVVAQPASSSSAPSSSSSSPGGGAMPSARVPFPSFEEWKSRRQEGGADETHEQRARMKRKVNPGANQGRQIIDSVDGAFSDDVGSMFEMDSTNGPQSGNNTYDEVDYIAPQPPKHEQTSPGNGRKKGLRRVPLKSLKERFNYAWTICAATVRDVNKEARGAQSILYESKDQYLLNKCAADKFIVIHLCDEILIDTIVLANFEFFSSTFKDFRVYVANTYPTTDWKLLGQWQARNARDLQVFRVHDRIGWFEYMKIEFLTHYGNEYYCPLSLVRVHGMTEMEYWYAVESQEGAAEDQHPDHEDEGDEEGLWPSDVREEIIQPQLVTNTSEWFPTKMPEEDDDDDDDEDELESGDAAIQDVQLYTETSTTKEDQAQRPLEEQQDASANDTPAVDAQSPTEVVRDDHADKMTQHDKNDKNDGDDATNELPTSSDEDEALLDTVDEQAAERPSVPEPSETSTLSSGAAYASESTPLTPITEEDEISRESSTHNASSSSPEPEEPLQPLPLPLQNNATGANATEAMILGEEYASDAVLADHVHENATVVLQDMDAIQDASTAAAAAASAIANATQNAQGNDTMPATPSTATNVPNKPPVQEDQARPIKPKEPTTQESIYKIIMKRLSALEQNATLSMHYLDEQNNMLNDVFSEMERRHQEQLMIVLERLNETASTRIDSMKRRYEQTYGEMKVQMDANIQEMTAKIGILSDQLTFERRVALAQWILVIFLFVGMALSRGMLSTLSPVMLAQAMERKRRELANKKKDLDAAAAAAAASNSSSSTATSAPVPTRSSFLDQRIKLDMDGRKASALEALRLHLVHQANLSPSPKPISISSTPTPPTISTSAPPASLIDDSLAPPTPPVAAETPERPLEVPILADPPIAPLPKPVLDRRRSSQRSEISTPGVNGTTSTSSTSSSSTTPTTAGASSALPAPRRPYRRSISLQDNTNTPVNDDGSEKAPNIAQRERGKEDIAPTAP